MASNKLPVKPINFTETNFVIKELADMPISNDDKPMVISIIDKWQEKISTMLEQQNQEAEHMIDALKQQGTTEPIQAFSPQQLTQLAQKANAEEELRNYRKAYKKAKNYNNKMAKVPVPVIPNVQYNSFCTQQIPTYTAQSANKQKYQNSLNTQAKNAKITFLQKLYDASQTFSLIESLQRRIDANKTLQKQSNDIISNARLQLMLTDADTKNILSKIAIFAES